MILVNKRIIFFLIISLIIGFSISVQSKFTKGQYLFVSSKVLQDYKTSIESEKIEVSRIKKLIQENQAKLNKYESITDQEKNLSDTLKKEEAYSKLISGLTDVEGEGVTVIIDDGTRPLGPGEDPNDIIVHDLDILMIINDLRNAGAEAISINNQRIMSDSEISCSGHSVRINDQFFARPFVIKAIGDSKMTEATLIAPTGYGSLLKDGGLIFKVTRSDHIKIPKYEEVKNYDFMSILKEGDL